MNLPAKVAQNKEQVTVLQKLTLSFINFGLNGQGIFIELEKFFAERCYELYADVSTKPFFL